MPVHTVFPLCAIKMLLLALKPETWYLALGNKMQTYTKCSCIVLMHID